MANAIVGIANREWHQSDSHFQVSKIAEAFASVIYFLAVFLMQQIVPTRGTKIRREHSPPAPPELVSHGGVLRSYDALRSVED